MMTTILTTLKSIKNYIIICLLSTLLVFGAFHYGSSTGYNDGYQRREEIAQKDISDMKVGFLTQLQNEKDRKQSEINKIKDDYNKQLEDLQATTDGVIDGLTTDNQRLYIKIKRSNTSSNNSQCSVTGQSDETAELSEGSSKFLIGQAIKADLWVSSLQKVIIKLNEDNKQLKEQLKEK